MICNRATANIILNTAKMKTFSLGSESIPGSPPVITTVITTVLKIWSDYETIKIKYKKNT